MDIEYIRISQLIIEIVLFIVLMFMGRFIYDHLKTHNIKILNPQEYFPEEELHSLRQIYFLIMMGMFFV